MHDWLLKLELVKVCIMMIDIVHYFARFSLFLISQSIPPLSIKLSGPYSLLIDY